MYLSRIALDETRYTTMRALSAPQKFHGAIESAFSGARRRRLWRLDRLNGTLYLLLLSEDYPNLSLLIQQFGSRMGTSCAETKDYRPLLQRIVPGSIWRFRLTANPTKSCPRTNILTARGKVTAHCTTDYQKQWLLERSEKHGFSLPSDGFTVTSSQWLQFTKGASHTQRVSLLSVTYEGILQVTDGQKFCEVLTKGIGRGKAYGLGLMTVMGGSAFHG